MLKETTGAFDGARTHDWWVSTDHKSDALPTAPRHQEQLRFRVNKYDSMVYFFLWVYSESIELLHWCLCTLYSWWNKRKPVPLNIYTFIRFNQMWTRNKILMMRKWCMQDSVTNTLVMRNNLSWIRLLKTWAKCDIYLDNPHKNRTIKMSNCWFFSKHNCSVLLFF